MDLKKIGILISLLTAGFSMYSQSSSDSPYLLDWKKDASIFTIGLGLSIGGRIAVSEVGHRSILEVENASFQNIFGLDEGANDNYSSSAARASDWALMGSAILPLTLLIDADVRRDVGKVAVLGSEAMLITYGLTNLAKGTVRRNRPFVFNDEVQLDKKLGPDSQLSFFSGHTSATATATFFTAKVWSDYNPDSKWKPIVWMAAATIPAATGYLRVKAGKHYTSDVITGYGVGALVGYFVPHLHRIKKGEKRKLRMSTSMIDQVPVFNVKYRF